tara:strand:+ start:93 stop:305 length:213 start_codon:yes stop_codon:yes gene_type:complete
MAYTQPYGSPLYEKDPNTRNKEREVEAQTQYDDSYKSLSWKDRRNVRKSIKNRKKEISAAESQTGLVQKD